MLNQKGKLVLSNGKEVFASEGTQLDKVREQDAFNFFGQSLEYDALSEIMLILTDGKTSEFNPQVMINSLTGVTLKKAVLKNNLKLAEFCLMAGVSPDGLAVENILTSNLPYKSNNLLTLAIMHRYTEMVDLLLKYNANPNGSEKLGSAGYPLYVAIAQKDVDMVEKLLSYGAKADVPVLQGVEIKEVIREFTEVFIEIPSRERYMEEKFFAINSLFLNYSNPIKRALEIYYEIDNKEDACLSLNSPFEENANQSFVIKDELDGMTSQIEKSEPAPVMEKDKQIQVAYEIVLSLIEKNPDCLNNMVATKEVALENIETNVLSFCNFGDVEHIYYDSVLAIACAKGDMDMVKFMLSKGAKLRKREEKYKNPIIDIDIECEPPVFETSKDEKKQIKDIEKYRFLIKDKSVSDELVAAVKSGNAGLVDYLIEQGAFVKYRLQSCNDKLYSVYFDAARGMAEAIENDDVNMVAILLHHGVQLSDNTYFYPLERYNTWEAKNAYRRSKSRMFTCEFLMDDSSHPKIYAMYKENGFEKHYQMLQKIWNIEQMMEVKKKEVEDQKRIEEEKQKLLEEQTSQLVQKVKKLPYESKVDPRGQDYLLIHQLALAGGLYLAAKEETPEVVNAWIPIFERVVSQDTLDKLMKLQNACSNVKQIG